MLIKAGHGIIDHHDLAREVAVAIQGSKKERKNQGVTIASAQRCTKGWTTGLIRCNWHFGLADYDAVCARGATAIVDRCHASETEARVEAAQIVVDRVFVGGEDLLAILVQFSSRVSTQLCNWV